MTSRTLRLATLSLAVLAWTSTSRAEETVAAPEVVPQSVPAPQPAPRVEESLPSPPPESMPTSTITESRRNPRKAAYTFLRPQWAFELEGSIKALGNPPSIPNRGDSTVRAIFVGFQYQPAFLQSLGVLGFGPTATLYPVLPQTGLTSNVAGFWALGGHLTYQARFFREQPLVPTAGYSAEYFNYRLAAGPSGHFANKGWNVGAMLLLNTFDPSAAADFYVNYRVTRSYLVGELRSSVGSDSNIVLNGQSIYFGLRIEF